MYTVGTYAINLVPHWKVETMFFVKDMHVNEALKSQPDLII